MENQGQLCSEALKPPMHPASDHGGCKASGPGPCRANRLLPITAAIALVRGTALTLYPDASPTESHYAASTRIAYQAEVTEEGPLVYRIHAKFEKNKTAPRIGQMSSVGHDCELELRPSATSPCQPQIHDLLCI